MVRVLFGFGAMGAGAIFFDGIPNISLYYTKIEIPSTQMA